MIMSGKCHIER